MSFLTQSHHVYLGCLLCLIPSTSHVIYNVLGYWRRRADVKGVTPLSCSEVIVVKRKDEVQRVIPAGWRQEGNPATKTLLQFLFIQYGLVL